MRSTVHLAGNVVTNPVLRSTASGPVTSFRIAVPDGWRDRTGQWQERTTFLTVSAWRDLGEHAAASLALGQPILLSGRLRQTEYEKDGVRHVSIEVTADAIGHDLRRGTASFERARRGPQTSDVAAGAPTQPSSVGDPATGEPAWLPPGLESEPAA